MDDRLNLIKVNLPMSQDQEKEGLGEGIFVSVSDEVKDSYDKNEDGTICEGRVFELSLCYPELEEGNIIYFKLRGENRPLCNFSFLSQTYGAPDVAHYSSKKMIDYIRKNHEEFTGEDFEERAQEIEDVILLNDQRAINENLKKKERLRFYIKVNIPQDEDSFREGYGEGVFVIVTEDVYKLYKDDNEGTICEGILDNDSFYFSNMKHGVNFPFEMRGEKRPVVLYSWIKENYL